MSSQPERIHDLQERKRSRPSCGAGGGVRTLPQVVISPSPFLLPVCASDTDIYLVYTGLSA